MNILLVDDDPITLKVVSALLRDQGHQVTVAHDGAEGLALFAAGNFPVVVTDWVMPRMDGLEMLRTMRREFPRLPVLLVSGRLPEVDLQDLLALGPTALLAKPYRLTDLRRSLDELRSVRG